MVFFPKRDSVTRTINGRVFELGIGDKYIYARVYDVGTKEYNAEVYRLKRNQAYTDLYLDVKNGGPDDNLIDTVYAIRRTAQALRYGVDE